MPDLSVASIAVRVSRYLPAKRVRVRSWKQRLFSRPWRPWVRCEWYEDHAAWAGGVLLISQEYFDRIKREATT